MPEPWEYASKDEIPELYRKVLYAFGMGPPVIQEAIGRTMGVKSPIERFREIERTQQPPAQRPREPSFQERLEERPLTEALQYGIGQIAPALSPAMPKPRLPEYLGGPPTPANVREAGLPGLERVLGPELSRPEFIATLPVGGAGAILPGLGGLAAMRGAEVASERAGLPLAAQIPLEIGAGLAGGGLTAIGQQAARRAAPQVAERAAPAVRRAVIEEAGGFRLPGKKPAPTFKEELTRLRTTRQAEAVTESRRKLINFVGEVKKLLPERARVLHKHRQRQYPQLDKTTKDWEAGKITWEEAQAQMSKALSGDVDFPELQKLSTMLTEADVASLRQSIGVRAREAGVGHYKLKNAQEALDQLRTKGQLAKHQIKLLDDLLGDDVGKALSELSPEQGKLLAATWEVIGVPRSIQASMDVSFPLRQGIMLWPRHPKIGAKQTWSAMRGFLSPKWAAQENAQILRERAEGVIPRTVDVTIPGKGTFAERTEPFVSNLAEKIPIIGNLVKRSEASFSVAGNRARRDISLSFGNRWSKNVGRELAEQEFDDVGRVANYLTGRGPVPRKAAYLLSQILYSPRFLTSKPAFLAKMVDPRTPNYLRRMMAEELVAFVGTGTVILTLLKMSGAADVEIDPRSSDFGKIKIGKMRFDIWGGGQQLVRYVTQLIRGERKSLGTGEIMKAHRQQVAARFAMSKLSPQAGIPLDLWRGESYMGEEIDPSPESIKTQIWNRMGPLAIQDIIEAAREEGLKGGLASLPALGGVGVLTFETPGEKIIKIAESKGLDWNKMSAGEKNTAAVKYPEIAKARDEQLAAAAKWGGTDIEMRQEEGAQFEIDFAEGLKNPQGKTNREFSDEMSNFLRDRATKGEIIYADYDRKISSDLEKLVNEYYSIELPSVATPEEREAFFQEQEDFLAAHPEVEKELHDLQVNRFRDPDVRVFAEKRWQARKVQKEYYDIPPFVGVSVEEGREVNRLLAEASALVRLGKMRDMKRALRSIPLEKYSDNVWRTALRADKYRNPERKEFRHEHAEELEMFEDLPYGEEPTKEVPQIPAGLLR